MIFIEQIINIFIVSLWRNGEGKNLIRFFPAIAGFDRLAAKNGVKNLLSNDSYITAFIHYKLVTTMYVEEWRPMAAHGWRHNSFYRTGSFSLRR